MYSRYVFASISFSCVLKAHPRNSWLCLEVGKSKEGPYLRAISMGRQGSLVDFQHLPRGKIKLTCFSHADRLFIIYNLIMFPLTGVTLRNNLLYFPEERVVFTLTHTSSFCFLISLSTSELNHCFSSWSVFWVHLGSEMNPGVFLYVSKRLAFITF